MISAVMGSPFPACSVVYRSATGGATLLVVCKRAFQLLPGEAPPASIQEPPNEEDNYWDDDPRRSLYSPRDIAPPKAEADVVLVGHAWSPGGVPARSIVARVKVAGIDKSVEVVADRTLRRDGSVLEGAPFVKLPLTYERAAGGAGTWNPVGVPAPDPSALEAPLPNLQPAGTSAPSWGVAIEPIGFGPIAPSWPARRFQLAGDALDFQVRNWHRAPLPRGLDPAYFNVAPRDQRVARLRGDEDIELWNLHAEHPRLVTRLPGLSPRGIARFSDGERSLDFVCDTLWIDTTQGLCSLVWRAVIQLSRADEPLAIEIEAARAARVSMSPPPPRPSPPPSRPSPPPSRPHEAHALHEDDPDHAPTRPVAVKRLRLSVPSIADEMTSDQPVPELSTTQPVRAAPAGAALPFVTPAPGAPLPPDRPSRPRRPPVFDLPGLESTQPVRAVLLPEAESIPALPFRLGGSTLRSPLEGTPRGTTLGAPTIHVEPTVDAEEEHLASWMSVPVEQPPMIGPLAHLLPLAGAEEEEEEASPAPRDTLTELPAEAPEPLPAKPPRDPASIPVDACARTAARLDLRPGEKDAILADDGLSASEHSAACERWERAIRADLTRGKTGLLASYDDAYVEALEQERGPVTPEKYAELVIAAERGDLDQALSEARIPRGAYLRVERVWLRRSLASPALSDRTRAAIERAREV